MLKVGEQWCRDESGVALNIRYGSNKVWAEAAASSYDPATFSPLFFGTPFL
jgi:hypothetical protein